MLKIRQGRENYRAPLESVEAFHCESTNSRTDSIELQIGNQIPRFSSAKENQWNWSPRCFPFSDEKLKRYGW